MTCDEVRDAIALVAVGDDEPVDPEVVSHLVLCDECTAAFRRYLETAGRLLDAVAPVEPPVTLRAAILERALAEQEGGREPALAGAPSAATPTAANGAPADRMAPRLARSRWAAAVLLLAALNVALLWDGRAAKDELARITQGVNALWAELDETWSAFSGAPAVYAGTLDFQIGQAAPGPQASAQGYVYARPNGWAVLFRIEGLSGLDGAAFDVWLDTGSGWERHGAVNVRPGGALSWIYYAREPEMSLRRVHVAGSGAMPGTPEWSTRAIASARVVQAAPVAGDASPRW